MKKVWDFVLREAVLTAACLAAAVSMLFVPPDARYAEYIDTSVLAILFCLMLVVAGLVRLRLFDVAAARLLRATRDSRRLSLLLVNLTFFSAMLVTNDVALLTLVPFTLGLLRGGEPKRAIFLVVMETLAANLGSMLTPVGNPQNLYLYAYYSMEAGAFFRTMLPLGAVSWGLLMLVTALPRGEALAADDTQPAEPPRLRSKWQFAVFLALFALCVLTVLRAVNVWICLAAVALTVLLLDRSLLRQVDFGLLLTFAAFFIFVGNLSRLEAVRQAASALLAGRELAAGVLTSQIISNVPAAILLSGFTQNASALLAGVNIGGLGTLVASLASLIAYKLYAKSEHARTGAYLKTFTLLNLLFLLVLVPVGWLLAGR